MMNNVKILLTTLLSVSSISAYAGAGELTGKEIAEDRKLGNCLACHMVVGGTLTGNIAPPLIAMKARYKDISELREQIWDPRIANVNSMMPPFGAHKILTPEQVDRVTKYIYSK